MCFRGVTCMQNFALISGYSPTFSLPLKVENYSLRKPAGLRSTHSAATEGLISWDELLKTVQT